MINNAEAQAERQGMVCQDDFPIGPLTEKVEEKDETWN